MEPDVGLEVAENVVNGLHVDIFAGAQHGGDDLALLAVDVLGLDALEGGERLGQILLGVLEGSYWSY